MNARRSADPARARFPKSSADLSADARRNATTQNTLRPVVCGCARCMVRKAADGAVSQTHRWSGEEDSKVEQLEYNLSSIHWALCILIAGAVFMLALIFGGS